MTDILERLAGHSCPLNPHKTIPLLQDCHTEIGQLRAKIATLESMNDHGMYMVCDKEEHRWIFGPKRHCCPVCGPENENNQYHPATSHVPGVS